MSSLQRAFRVLRIACHVIRSKIVGSPNLEGGRVSLAFYSMAPFTTDFIQSSSLLVHLWLESELLDCSTAPVRACGRMRVEEQFHQHLLDDYATDLERAEARIIESRRTIHNTPQREPNRWFLNDQAICSQIDPADLF